MRASIESGRAGWPLRNPDSTREKLIPLLGPFTTVGTNRRFARFSKDDGPLQTLEIPEGGLCLSVFIVLTKRDHPDSVLMGRLNADAPWDHIGALDSARAEQHSKGWMLPSSHLMFRESPQDGAKRVLTEQLGLNDQVLNRAEVFSEVYGPSNHWDIEFVLTGEREEIRSHPVWKELAFVELNRVRKEELARSHEDILAHLGKWRTR